MKNRNILVLTLGLLTLINISCSKTQSYSELLREEEKACNWYLASKNVMLELPEDARDLITSETIGEDGLPYGEDAPFYKLDEEGYVYMQVVVASFEEMVDEGDLVYFRFLRSSIKDMYEGLTPVQMGNQDYLPNGTTSFVYKNTFLSSSTTWGTGVQMPLKYVGYNSEVNLVLKSYYGFTDEQTYCVPYIMNIKYFKPEY
ncbi:MAG: DUF4827 family protein [Muribaculaceae bacterium]|nr:DUF4827 family protein [Muribaculaceae bacterium]